MSLRRRQQLVVDESACSVVVACAHCGATFGPYRDADEARRRGLEHWDAWHRSPEDQRTTCRAPACERDARSLGLCSMHYLRERRRARRSVAA